MLKLLRALMSDRKGATAVEYGLIVSLVVIAILGAVNGLADVTIDMWQHVETSTIKATEKS